MYQAIMSIVYEQSTEAACACVQLREGAYVNRNVS